MVLQCSFSKGEIISNRKDFLVSSNSPKKGTNESIVVVKRIHSFVHFLGEFEDTKKSFGNYLTFSEPFSNKVKIQFSTELLHQSQTTFIGWRQ